MPDVLDDSNPYRSPETAVAETPPSNGPATKFDEVGRVVVTWEKLRLVYNAIGAVPTLLIAAMAPEALVGLVLCGLFANLAFCLGPLVDGYLTWFGLRHQAVTAVLFVLGTGLMLLLAAGVGLSLMTFDKF